MQRRHGEMEMTIQMGTQGPNWFMRRPANKGPRRPPAADPTLR